LNHANSTRFLLAQLYLESLTGKRSPKAVQIALKNLVTGSAAYDHAYKDAMERINGQIEDQEELAKQVLSWITCAKRPLTTTELQHALGVEVGECKLDELNFSEIEDIVSVCAGLVTIDEESGIIRLVHYTAQEYFERTQRQWFPNAETDITTICVTYLSFSAFESGFCQTDTEFIERFQSYPLYNYAAHNWGHHARVALTLSNGIIDFLESKAKVEASSQAMRALTSYSSYFTYSRVEPRHMTGLHLAAYFGLEKAANALLRDEHGPDLTDSCSRTPLWYAVENGHEAVVKLLLDKGADPDSTDENGLTPLWYAAENGHEAVVKLLLDKGADPLSTDENGLTPIWCAAGNGHEAVVKLLLKRCAGCYSMCFYSPYGSTPLSSAAAGGHEAVVKLLLEEHFSPCERDVEGETALMAAAERGYEAIVKLMLEHLKRYAPPDLKDFFRRMPLSDNAWEEQETLWEEQVGLCGELSREEQEIFWEKWEEQKALWEVQKAFTLLQRHPKS
jgi:hypothetical protein